MRSDPIFRSLQPVHLLEICALLSFDPIVAWEPLRSLSALADDARLAWADNNRGKIEEEISSVGSWTFGPAKPYSEMVEDLARKVGALFAQGASTADVERSLVIKIWDDAISKLTPQQAAELKARAQEVAAKYGKSLGSEVTGFAALGAAQISGFGVYLLGSTVLGAINGALGLGLSFGAFTGLSSLISTVTGPVGWAALGLVTIVKLGAPNYKKIRPVVIFIATRRSLTDRTIDTQDELASSRGPILLPTSPSNPSSHGGSGENVRGSSAGASQGKVDELKADLARATRKATEEKQPRRDTPKHRIVSKLDRMVFNQRPENKLLREVASENTGEHFLDLSYEDQEAIRKMAKERLEIEALEAQDEERQFRGARQEAQPADKANEVFATEQVRRRWKNHFKASLPYLEFSDRAIDRFIEFENTDLHVSFVKEFRMLNEGFLSDKHHIPKTAPKLFQKDCGHRGKVYYRRGIQPRSVHIELLGDKNSQKRDLSHLMSSKSP